MSYQSSGSGIYSNGNIMDYYFNPSWSPAQSLMVATIPKYPQTISNIPSDINNDAEPEMNIGEDNLLKHTLKMETGVTNISTFIALPSARGSLVVSAGNLTCSASYQVSYLGNVLFIISYYYLLVFIFLYYYLLFMYITLLNTF